MEVSHAITNNRKVMSMYNIVESHSRIGLIISVLDDINEGWKPIGGAFVTDDGIYCQTMICNGHIEEWRKSRFKSYGESD